MADGVFNIAKGKVSRYAMLPGANDGFDVVLLKAAGLEDDDTLRDHDTLAAVLASTNDEYNFTNYARKQANSPTITVNDIDNFVDVDIADKSWTAAGGATNNTIGKLLVCYVPDRGVSTDSDVVPLTYHDFLITTDGGDLTADMPSAGFYRAS